MVASPPRPATGDADEAARALGSRIRALRTARSMTLAALAEQAGLSHSFLSQVERGLERLSMSSLFRIAAALGTTQQALLTADTGSDRGGRFHVFRHGGGSPLDAGGSPLRVLAEDAPPFLPMIFSGTFEDDDVWWTHDEEEFLFVLEGRITVSLGDEDFVLVAGESTYYEGGVTHRWVTAPGDTCRLLVVKERRQGDGA